MASPARKLQSVGEDASPPEFFTPEEEQALAQHAADCAWLEEHRDELYAKYPKHSIAVYKGEVVAVSTSVEAMIDEAHQAVNDDIRHVVVDYLRGPDEIFIL